MSQEKIERWNEVDGNLDNGEKLQAFLDSTTDAYAILQLRRTDETVYERFESYEALKRQGKEPNIDHYDVVYVAPLSSILTRLPCWKGCTQSLMWSVQRISGGTACPSATSWH